MATPIRMPALGQTSDELRLVAWLKAEGDAVRAGEPLLEIETDKATLEVEASSSGTLLRILHAEGTTLEAGTLVGWLGEQGEPVPERQPAPAAGTSPAPGQTEPRPAPERGPSAVSEGASRVLATPAARTLARELGLELSRISGSGPEGRIERRDVEAVAAAPAPGERAVPVPRNRRAIAARLARAAVVPQFSLSRTIDARPALARCEQMEGLTLTHLLLRAVARALRQHPDVNRIWIEDGPRMRQLDGTSVGLAIASESNLIVATIPDPDRLSLEELVTTTRRAVEEGRAGRLANAFSGPAAVTVSNLGMFGVDRFEAIVDPEQTAILAVGRVLERPAVSSEGLVAVKQLDLTLSVDHRTVDGALGARFLVAVSEALESDPGA